MSIHVTKHGILPWFSCAPMFSIAYSTEQVCGSNPNAQHVCHVQSVSMPPRQRSHRR